MLAAEISACGSTRMGFDACGSVLVAKIGACVLTKSMLMGFNSCGAYGGDWCLWWISDLTISGKRRRRCLWREVFDRDLERKKEKLP